MSNKECRTDQFCDRENDAQCHEMTCDLGALMPEMPNGKLDSETETLNIGDVVDFKCDPGFLQMTDGAPVKTVKVKCASRASEYNETRDSLLRTVDQGLPVKACVPGNHMTDHLEKSFFKEAF